MFRSPANGERRSREEDNPFLLSFSDLMAGLLAVFILALVVMMIQLFRKQQELEEDRQKIKITLVELVGSLEEIDETQSAIASALDGISLREQSLAAILEGVKEDLKERGIEIVVAENGSVLRIPENALHFELGMYDILEEFHPAADAIGAALLMALERKENLDLLDTVFIEGHTDDVPNAAEMGNWGLSTDRAISLWKYWTEDPGGFSRLKELKSNDGTTGNGSKPLISVSGYAETRPTDNPPLASDPDSTQIRGNPSDRRIDIRFTIAASEKKNLESLQNKMKDIQKKTRDLISSLKEE